jgi:hypothetical protein
LQTLRDVASNAQAAAAAASLQAKEECDARHQLAQQLELKTSQNASLMAEGSVWQLPSAKTHLTTGRAAGKALADQIGLCREEAKASRAK